MDDFKFVEANFQRLHTSYRRTPAKVASLRKKILLTFVGGLRHGYLHPNPKPLAAMILKIILEPYKMMFIMALADKIYHKVQKLPQTSQGKVLDFVEFLTRKKRANSATKSSRAWEMFSLTSALKDMRNEPAEYSRKDLKEKFT